ncbi:hypothetical protein BU15DRAFT_82295 [Melanogaster broomeanus]|nr:hypothetical protein BU15DRAFT_82295 [Melanogaster broomeanus]
MASTSPLPEFYYVFQSLANRLRDRTADNVPVLLMDVCRTLVETNAALADMARTLNGNDINYWITTVDTISGKLDKYKEGFNKIDISLGKHEERFDDIDASLDKIWSKLDKQKERLNKIDASLGEHDERFNEIAVSLHEISSNCEERFDNIDTTLRELSTILKSVGNQFPRPTERV